MNFFFLFTILAASLISTAKAACEDCKYDCPLIGKDFYGSDISCGYNLAQDWKTCGEICKNQTLFDP